jgi:hypothetical protein
MCEYQSFFFFLNTNGKTPFSILAAQFAADDSESLASGSTDDNSSGWASSPPFLCP